MCSESHAKSTVPTEPCLFLEIITETLFTSADSSEYSDESSDGKGESPQDEEKLPGQEDPKGDAESKDDTDNPDDTSEPKRYTHS